MYYTVLCVILYIVCKVLLLSKHWLKEEYYLFHSFYLFVTCLKIINTWKLPLKPAFYKQNKNSIILGSLVLISIPETELREDIN